MATVRWRVIPIEGGGAFYLPVARLPPIVPGNRVRTLGTLDMGEPLGSFTLPVFEGIVTYVTEGGTFADVRFDNGIHQYRPVSALRRIYGNR